MNEIKCEKMLVKLKAFKEKNERLQLTLDETQRNSERQLWEVRRGLEEQLQGLRIRLRDVETYNGQLIHENNTLKEAAAKASRVASVSLSGIAEISLVVFSTFRELCGRYVMWYIVIHTDVFDVILSLSIQFHIMPCVL